MSKCFDSITEPRKTIHLLTLTASIWPSATSLGSASRLPNSRANPIEQGLPRHGPHGGKAVESGLRSRPLFLCSFLLPCLLALIQFCTRNCNHLANRLIEFLELRLVVFMHLPLHPLASVPDLGYPLCRIEE